MPRRRAPEGFTLIELLVVIAIIGVLIALLLPAVQASRAAARRIQCVNNEMQMAIAIQNYESSHESLPPGSVCLTGPVVDDGKGYQVSWMVQILPFMDQRNIYNHLNFSVGIHDGANSTARTMKIASFLCPQDAHANDLAQGLFAMTSYMGVHNDAEAPIDVTNNGALTLNSRVRTEDIEDGASNTLLLGEARVAGELSGWGVGTRSTLRNGGWGINGLPPGTSGPTPTPTPRSVGGFSSWHAGGANFAFCDGSVKFLKTGIGPTTLKTLCNRRDGEMLSSGSY